MTMSAPLPSPLPPWPDDDLAYVSLPVSGDDGFPQAFLLQIQGVIYRLTLSVYYPDPDLILNAAYVGVVFDLPDPVNGLYLNLRAEFENQPQATRLIGAQRVTLNIPIALGPLRFRFQRVRIAQANLVGPGAFGSSVTADVAVANG
jgi:hypothetical protein